MALACTLHGASLSSGRPYQPLLYVVSSIIFDKDNRTYMAGETITGTVKLQSLPVGVPDIHGLYLHLEGQKFLKDPRKDTKEKKLIVEKKRYFLGNGIKKLGPLKEGEYPFAFPLPQDCPPTFDKGKFGWQKYTMKCVVHQSIEGPYAFEPEEITITACSSPWKNYKSLIQPAFAEKEVSSFMLSGKIQMWLNTDQKCYQSGDKIRFVLKVRNGGGKNVKGILMQLQQIVNYDFQLSKQSEKILFPRIIQGPSVPTDYTQIWKGDFDLPFDLQPSIEGCAKKTEISFQYSLRVTLQMAGSYIPNINEEFAIQVGCPLETTLSPSAPPEPRRYSAYQFPAPTAPRLDVSGTRRLSMASLAPSLPDYDTAVRRLGNGQPPPSYSNLELSSGTSFED